MALLTAKNLCLAYGSAALLDRVQLSLERGDRVCIVGRNGEGKSTLLRVLAGEIQPDAGEISQRGSLVTGYLTQEIPDIPSGSIFDVVAGGLGQIGKLLERFHQLSLEATSGDAEILNALGSVQAQLDASDGWALQQRVESTLSRLALPPDVRFSNLSGGLRRRVWLARQLVSSPDLLLLDEPTNHLDIAAIQWLENLLTSLNTTLVFVSHDRRFADAVATRLIELDRGQLYEYPPGLDNFRLRQQQRLDAEATQRAEFDRKLAQEEVWIRQGIKARRTRNEGRVRALEALRRQRAERRERQGNVKLSLRPEQRSGRRVIELERASFGYDRAILSDVDLLVQRGDRLGIVGLNGSGKTTLLRGMLGELPPLQGHCTLGTHLEIAYFDQIRETLNPEETVQYAVGGGRDRLEVHGRTRHILSYLEDFLFSPARARQPIGSLSGGERNRLLLARLFLRPANLLVLDEPTNDLDVETLELLEMLLIEYTGTVLLVSHDRSFLDNVVTSLLVLDGKGRAEEFVGGWDQLPPSVVALFSGEPSTPAITARTDSASSANGASSSNPAAPPAPVGKREPKKPSKRLSYREEQELEQLPDRIMALEQRLQELSDLLSDPDTFRDPDAEKGLPALNQELATVEQQLNAANTRWEELEQRKSG